MSRIFEQPHPLHLRVDSLDDPRLDVYRHLKKNNENRHEDLLIAEGTTVVERLLRSDYVVRSVLVTDQKFPNFQSRLTPDVVVHRVTRDLATQLVGFEFHLGVLAAAERKPSPLIQDAVPATGSSLVLLGDHITDQQNVGLLIRIAAAFGVDAVIFSRGSTDPFSRRVMRVSMANNLLLPVIESLDTETTLEQLYRLNYTPCATVLDETATTLADFSFSERTVLVFGNESHGIAPSLISGCNTRLTVPMLNGTDSLNVSIAAGIFCHTYRSQYPNRNSDGKR
ncbi:MAG: RNA methyltransferase [Fuerstiella sp.]|nr:RNA methyltransferase [Fuerstiella sp.]MCP4856517.1 RNA methyltransferase [Fuerstiella sp.]